MQALPLITSDINLLDTDNIMFIFLSPYTALISKP